MKQVGQPDDRLTLSRAKQLRRDLELLDHGAPERLVGGMGRGFSRPEHSHTHPIVVDDRPFVSAGVVFERSRVLADILERDPNPAHESLGDRGEVHGIGMEFLLGSNRKIQRLEWKCLAPEHVAENSDKFAVRRNGADVRVESPRVLQPASLFLQPLGGKLRLQITFDALGTSIKFLIRKIENSVTIPMQALRYARGLRAESA